MQPDDDSPIHVSLWTEVLHHVRLAEPTEGTPEHIHWQIAMELLTTGKMPPPIPTADDLSEAD